MLLDLTHLFRKNSLQREPSTHVFMSFHIFYYLNSHIFFDDSLRGNFKCCTINFRFYWYLCK